jgi:predicted RNA-binding protein YlqC (UPF0109 family)
MSSIDQQFIEYIVKSLVGKPEAVSIDRRIDEKGVLLELTVDPEDLGRVIGKRGATAQSLRTLLRALGTKNEARYNLKIVDNGEPRPMNGGDASTNDTPASDDTADDDKLLAQSTTPKLSVSDELDLDDDESVKPVGSKTAQTRKELEELDDLDI